MFGLHKIPLTKDNISELETERESIHKYVREGTGIIDQQTEELSQLKEKLERLERQKNDFSVSQRCSRTFDIETSDGIRTELKMTKFPKEEINKD